MEPVVVDYSRCVGAIVPSVLGLSDASWLPEAVDGAKTIVLLVVDGLGWRALQDHPTALPNLLRFAGGPTTTVFPATTAAALTSITTWTSPSQHGLTGYRVRVEDNVLNVLRWKSEARGVLPPAPAFVQRVEPFCGQHIPIVIKAEHVDSGFTQAHLRGADISAWVTNAAIVANCSRLATQGHRLIYAYYSRLDEVAHEFGLLDGAYEAELRNVDALVAELRNALPSECALMVTADHGQVHIEADAWVDLGSEIESILVAQSGDARARYLYARPGAQKELGAVCRERFGELAWVKTRKELIEEQWLGQQLGKSVPGRIGDVCLMPFAPVGFVDRAMPRERNLKSAHGAPTTEEMQVPLLAARGEI